MGQDPRSPGRRRAVRPRLVRERRHGPRTGLRATAIAMSRTSTTSRYCFQAGASNRAPGHPGGAASRTLAQLAAEVSEDPDNDVSARQIESEAEAVQIMTVHVAKGLEFPVVCVPTLWRKSYATQADEVVFRDRATRDGAPSTSQMGKPVADQSRCQTAQGVRERGGSRARTCGCCTWRLHSRARDAGLVEPGGGGGRDRAPRGYLHAGERGCGSAPRSSTSSKVELPPDARELSWWRCSPSAATPWPSVSPVAEPRSTDGSLG